MVKNEEQDLFNDNYSQELETRDLLLILKRNKVTIILTTFAATFLLSLVAFSRKPVFEGRQLLFVNNGFNANEYFLKQNMISARDKNKYITYCSKSYSPIDVYKILSNQAFESKDVEVTLVRNSNIIQLKIKSDSKSNLFNDFDFVIKKYQKTFVDIFDKCKDNNFNQFNTAKSLLINRLKEQNSSEETSKTKKLIKEIDRKIVYLQQETFDNNSLEIIPVINFTVEDKSNKKFILLRSLLISLVFSFIVLFLKEINSNHIYDKSSIKKLIKYRFLGYLIADQKQLNKDLFLENLKIDNLWDSKDKIKFLKVESRNSILKDNSFIFENINIPEIKIEELSELSDSDNLILLVRSSNLKYKDLFIYLNRIRNMGDKIIGWYLIDY